MRREILDAARELFVAEGYGNVSLRKIARRIGYTPMSIYLHFKDKAEILDCICEETFTGFLELAAPLDQSVPEPFARLRAGLHTFIDFGLAHPHHYQLTFMAPPQEQAALGRRREIGGRAYKRLRTLVAACLGEPLPSRSAAPPAEAPEDIGAGDQRETGPLPEPLDVATQVIMATVHGLVSLLIARPDFPWQERELLIAGAVRSATGLLTRHSSCETKHGRGLAMSAAVGAGGAGEGSGTPSTI